MFNDWSFSRRLTVSLAVLVVMAIAMSLGAMSALRTVVSSKDHVITDSSAKLHDALNLRWYVERRSNNVRSFVLSAEQRFLDALADSKAKLKGTVDHLRALDGSPEARPLLDAVEVADAAYEAGSQHVIAMRRANAPQEALIKAFDENIQTPREHEDAAVAAVLAYVEKEGEELRQSSGETAASAIGMLGALSLGTVAIAVALGWLLSSALSNTVGGAVVRLQSSSAELHAAARQQESGAREQAVSLASIGTTTVELLATSRQISESAQRVSQIASQTAGSARTGDQTVQQARYSMDAIRKNVDRIVSHMLELGQKSQQIGGILEITNELAEQTNILAINATIEAAGAGEGGKRFGVVADEIRRLADRVSASTREIRTLIDEIRSATNTTVMATEAGAKAVDSGSQHFAELAGAFSAISTQVSTTAEAAREIELSTKQQSSAVEQVTVAVTSVATATKQAEASAVQTLQTVTELTALTGTLSRLVQAERRA